MIYKLHLGVEVPDITLAPFKDYISRINPLKSVANFPENIPVVFITSEKDVVVTPANTENIANALARKGKNDVYLLKLKHSSHPNYMFDDANDRDCYETFIHAIYKKYNLKHESELASKGEALLDSCVLNQVSFNNNQPITHGV